MEHDAVASRHRPDREVLVGLEALEQVGNERAVFGGGHQRIGDGLHDQHAADRAAHAIGGPGVRRVGLDAVDEPATVHGIGRGLDDLGFDHGGGGFGLGLVRRLVSGFICGLVGRLVSGFVGWFVRRVDGARTCRRPSRCRRRRCHMPPQRARTPKGRRVSSASVSSRIPPTRFSPADLSSISEMECSPCRRKGTITVTAPDSRQVDAAAWSSRGCASSGWLRATS